MKVPPDTRRRSPSGGKGGLGGYTPRRPASHKVSIERTVSRTNGGEETKTTATAHASLTKLTSQKKKTANKSQAMNATDFSKYLSPNDSR
jgi:hypothetical protein